MSVLHVVLGAAQIGMPYGVANREGMISDQTAQDLLRRAYALGYRVVDTAQSYGESETRIGAYQRQNSANLFQTITKLSADVDLGSAMHIETAVSASLGRLGAPLFGMLLHHGAMLQQWNGPLGETLEALKLSGLILNLGASVYSSDELEMAIGIPAITFVQVPFHVFDQSLAQSGMLARARARGMTIFVRSVYLQGLLIMPFQKAIDRVPAAAPFLKNWWSIVEASGRTAQEVAFQFVRHQLPQAYLVIGAETTEQLAANISLALSDPLDVGILHALETFGAVPDSVASPRYWTK